MLKHTCQFDMAQTKTFVYRIYPTHRQIEKLTEWSNVSRFLWNLAHEQRIYAKTRSHCDRKLLSAFDQIRELTELRKENQWISRLPRGVSNDILVRLDLAWSRFLSGLSEFPKWKKKSKWTNVTEPHYKSFRLTDNTLKFTNLGHVRAVVHRL